MKIPPMECCLSVLALSACLALPSGPAQAFPEILPDSSRFARAIPDITIALSKRGYDMQPASLEKALAHENPVVRMDAMMGLAVVGTPREIPAMKRLLSDPSIPVRLTAITALADMRKHLTEVESNALKTDLAKAATKALADSTRDDHRICAARTLMEVADDPSGYPVVLAALKGTNIPLRGLACVSCPVFTTHKIRDAAGKEVDWIMPLAAIVRDETAAEVTRSAAITALSGINTSRSSEALTQLGETVEHTHLRLMISTILARPGSQPPTSP